MDTIKNEQDTYAITGDNQYLEMKIIRLAKRRMEATAKKPLQIPVNGSLKKKKREPIKKFDTVAAIRPKLKVSHNR